jgi:hypothetical protein
MGKLSSYGMLCCYLVDKDGKICYIEARKDASRFLA